MDFLIDSINQQFYIIKMFDFDFYNFIILPNYHAYYAFVFHELTSTMLNCSTKLKLTINLF